MIHYGALPEPFNHLDKARVVILPVPYDGTSTWIKGADKGPEALLEASANMELYDIETNSEVYQQGIFTADPVTEASSPEKVYEATREATRKYLNMDKFVVMIGGEHSVTAGPVKAHAEKYPGMSVLQLDAHTDLRPEYEGSKYNHACVMSRVSEICPIVQVGIRSMDIEEKQYIRQDRIFYAENMAGSTTWIDKVVDMLSEDVYITVDLDVFDPSVMPSTGTPEPGGMLWYETLQLLKKVIQEKNMIGFDIVELCPDEHNKAPDFLAAKLLYKMLSYKFK
ncbi:MAG TPA: agmatinase [Bacteroidales bacterium]|nr:agmatinase [Bacteroidales bacterium]